MDVNKFIEKVKSTPLSIDFKETMAVIEAQYTFNETAFKNGETYNEAGQNSGSCKLFAFSKLHNLNKEETLACFGDYYRKDVLENPQNKDHANIRNFMKFGWDGIKFESEALS